MSRASATSLSPDPYGTRHNVHWSFSKASRFRPLKASSSADYVDLPTTFSKSRSPSFGYGKRWEPHNLAGKDAPPPTTYKARSCFDLQSAGPAFGHPGLHSERSYLPPSQTPGPGEYKVQKNLGDGAPKFSMKARRVFERKSDTPPPGLYSPNTSFLDNHRFSAVTFGVGARKFLAKSSKSYIDAVIPGPGTYDIPSVFHRRSPSMPIPRLPMLKPGEKRSYV